MGEREGRSSVDHSYKMQFIATNKWGEKRNNYHWIKEREMQDKNNAMTKTNLNNKEFIKFWE